MIILLHSSKTMRITGAGQRELREPLLLERARQLDGCLKTLTAAQLQKVMSISPSLAQKTRDLIQAWQARPERPTPAADSFSGDIYSGLQVGSFSPADREYAEQSLRILSGLYGILRPDDGIYPYRLEMGYSLPCPGMTSLYEFWGSSIAGCLPQEGPIINLAAEEYARTVTRYTDAGRVITPRFLTVNPKTRQPAFIVVHAKIARGAFARWLITHRIRDERELNRFDEIGYQYEPALSEPSSPAFVCETFQGKGLSIRLQ